MRVISTKDCWGDKFWMIVDGVERVVIVEERIWAMSALKTYDTRYDVEVTPADLAAWLTTRGFTVRDLLESL